MKIAIFSDSHDHLDLIEGALGLAKERGITQGIHLGDYCMPYVFELLAESGIQWTCVWGNNDGDKVGGEAKGGSAVDIVSGDFREVDMEGRKLFLTHYPQIARLAARTGDYDAVFHGHSHQRYQEQLGKTLLANPGAVSGLRTENCPTFGIYDTADNSFELVEIPR